MVSSMKAKPKRALAKMFKAAHKKFAVGRNQRGHAAVRLNSHGSLFWFANYVLGKVDVCGLCGDFLDAKGYCSSCDAKAR
jgi:hypothetical protein